MNKKQQEKTIVKPAVKVISENRKSDKESELKVEINAIVKKKRPTEYVICDFCKKPHASDEIEIVKITYRKCKNCEVDVDIHPKFPPQDSISRIPSGEGTITNANQGMPNMQIGKGSYRPDPQVSEVFGEK